MGNIYNNLTDEIIKLKKDIAQDMYKLKYIYDEKGAIENKEHLDEVLLQIEVCEGMMRGVSLETISDWIHNKTANEVYRAARKIKFAS